MKVATYCINKGHSSQYFVLVNAEENFVLPYTPEWKTEKGAIRWALNHGYKVVDKIEGREEPNMRYQIVYTKGSVPLQRWEDESQAAHDIAERLRAVGYTVSVWAHGEDVARGTDL